MKTKRCCFLIVVSFLVFTTIGNTRRVAGKFEPLNETTPRIKFVDKRGILAGLEGVGVIVEELGSKDRKYGLTKQAIQTDVELRLRKYGLRVFSSKERFQTVGMPFLYVNVNALIDEELGLTATTITVELHEEVMVLRDPAMVHVSATTWDGSFTLFGGTSKLKQVRQDVRDLVDEFINDYLAANPKETEAKSKSN